MRLKSRGTILAALIAAVVTLVVALAPALHFAYRKPALHVALEVAASLIALLAAYLVFGRLRRSGALTDLVLTCALALLATSNLVFAAVPATLTEGTTPGATGTWAATASTLLGALLLAAAALLPDASLRRPRRAAGIALVTTAGVLALLGIGLLAARGALPAGVQPGSAATSSRPDLDAHPAVLAVQIAAMLAFAAAAIGFARRAAHDELLGWLALGATLAAFARLNYFLYPSLYSQWVYVGDGFRLLFYVALLAGLTREIGRYWRGLSEAAVLDERRRLARDLHDGLAQELAVIARRTRRSVLSSDDAAQIGAAAERALDESRRAIAALTRPLDEPLDVALAQAAEEVASRTGARISLDLVPGVELSPEGREAVIRIACEAVSNAARHAHASSILVELADEQGLRLRVVDDGVGFDPDVAVRENLGFGLTSMRERAQLLGAELDICSHAGAGTEVSVRL